MNKVVYKYKDEFQIDEHKDGYMLSMLVERDGADSIYQFLEFPALELGNLFAAIGTYFTKKNKKVEGLNERT